jgi:O-antigen/teichoic acid export membrane protein
MHTARESHVDHAGSRRRRGSVAQLATSGYVTTAFALVTGPITARVLGPSGRGELTAAVVYSTYLAIILSLGLPTAVGYALATGRSGAGALLASVLRYAGLLVVPSVVTGMYAGLALSRFTTVGRVGVAVLIGLTPVAVVGLCIEAMIRARGELGVLTRTRFLALGFPAVAVVLLWLTGTLSVLSMTVTTVTLLALVVTYTWSRLQASPRDAEPLRPLLRYGFRSAPGMMATAVSARLDQALIAPILGATALGLYSVAVTVSALPLALAWAVSTRAFAEVGTASEDDKLLVASKYIRMALLLSIPATLGVAVASPVVMPLLYGAAFKSSLVPTLLLLPSTVALSFLGPAELCMSALGRPGRASAAEGAGTAVGVVALLVLLKPLGIRGAALATSLDFGVSAAVLIFFYRRLGRCSLFPGRSDVLVLVGRAVVGARRSATAARRPPRTSGG